MKFTKDNLILKGKAVIASRLEGKDYLDLSPQFCAGFEEGVAEFITAILNEFHSTKESATDILTELEN
ncbi:MAG: hypothetical protein WCS03_18935 [Bacteroidota bacterium]